MRAWVGAIAALAVGFPLNPGHAQSAGAAAVAEDGAVAAIEDIAEDAIEDLKAAWAAGDAAAWAAVFAEDAEMVLPRGLRVIGRDAIETGHEGVFATIYQDTSLTVSVDHVRALAPDVALVAFHQTIEPAPGKTPQGSAGQDLISTMIIQRTGDGNGWRIAYLDTIPAAPADFELPTAQNPPPNGE